MAGGESNRVARPSKPRVHPVPDGKELLSTKQAAELLDTPVHTLLTAVQRGKLHPAKLPPRRLIFTRSEVVAWHRERRGEGEKLEREKAMCARFAQGAHPMDVYLETEGATLKETLAVLHSWAPLAGCWIVEGPRGSYARWLQRVGLMELRPREMRRVIEALLVDPYVAKVAGLALDQARAAAAQLAAAQDTKRPNEATPRRRYAEGSKRKGR